MTLSVTVPAPEGADPATLDAVAQGAGQLLQDLGYPGTDVETKCGTSLAVGRDEVPPSTGHVGSLRRHVDTLLDRLTSHRVLVVAAALQDHPPTDPVDRAARLLFAALGVRWPKWPHPGEGITEQSVAAQLALTDDHPLRIVLHPEDVERQVPDATEQDLAARAQLYDRFSLALPPILVLDEGTERGTAVIRVRDVELPPLPLSRDPEDAQQALWGHCLDVVAGNVPALVTALAVEAALELTADALPTAARLAERRWTAASLATMLRFRIPTLHTGPADLPAVIEWCALTELPVPTALDPVAQQLLERFPGLVAADPPWLRHLSRPAHVRHAEI